MGKTMWAHGWRTSTESVVAKHNGAVEACGVGGSAMEGKNNTSRRRHHISNTGLLCPHCTDAYSSPGRHGTEKQRIARRVADGAGSRQGASRGVPLKIYVVRMRRAGGRLSAAR